MLGVRIESCGDREGVADEVGSLFPVGMGSIANEGASGEVDGLLISNVSDTSKL